MSDSVDVKLDIVQEMELPKSLKYAEYDSNKIINKSEVQLEDKAYRSYPATSADGNEVEWSIPSIAGGSIRRCLEHEVPVYAQVTYSGIQPSFSIGTAPIAIGAQVFDAIFGSSPTPLNPLQSSIDQAPLSKIFGERAFTINNASTVLTENLDHQEVDMLVAGADLEKMENDNLEPFVTSNICAFETLTRASVGHIIPHGWNLNNDPFSSPLLAKVAENSLMSAIVLSRRTRFSGNLAQSWASKRNSGRNIVKFEVVSITGGAPTQAFSTDVIGYENIKCPVPTIATFPQPTVAGYYSTPFTYLFKWTIREQLWSNHWFNDYNYDRNIWNQLMPVSALNVKYTIKKDYLSKNFLQVGDNIHYVNASGNKYTIDNVYVSTSQNELKLNLYSQKVPSHFINQNAYKLMFMDKASKQGQKPVFADAVDGSGNATIFKATQEYNNLTQVPEFIQTCLPIQKSVFLKKLYGTSFTPPDCTLPSVFNLPITGLQMTFNDESDLGLFQQDQYQLQKITIDNLQELKCLKDVVVGKSMPFHQQEVDDAFTNAGATVLATEQQVWSYIASESLQSPELATSDRTQPSMPVSCSQFTLLKLGRDVRLPVGMCAGQLITFNMTVTAICDLTKLPVYNGFYDTVSTLRNFTAGDLTQPLANMQNYFYNKKIVTLSGRASSTVYVHNIYITLNQYKTMLADIKTAFSKLDRDDIFDSRLIMGGSLFGRMKDAVDWVKPKLKKAVDVAKTVSDVTGLAPPGLRTGLDIASNVLGSGMAENVVHAGRSQNAVTAGKIDWKKMLKS